MTELYWCVTDQYGRPCNGGDRSQRLTSEWSEPIDDPKICHRGYHVTTDPLRWAGSLVSLVEVDEVLDAHDDKRLVRRRRAIARVDPDQCIDLRIWVACQRPHLHGLDLRGADLRGANLRGADLRDADLRGADLRDADLYGADLRDADLRDADLSGADLRGADLSGADLYGADLSGADLYGAIGLGNG
jgi:hypothetical protein